jgi:hypothetical protein
MDLSFLGRLEWLSNRSLRWPGLHPALSSAFMQSPPSRTWAVDIWPVRTGLDPGEIKTPPDQGGSYAPKALRAIGQPHWLSFGTAWRIRIRFRIP